MSFSDFPTQARVVQLLQRSLERKRLGHAYLFAGESLDDLEGMARTLAKALNCQAPARSRFDSCDQCDSCHRMDEFNHPDVLWIRPESKSRIITVDQTRELMRTLSLKPTLAEIKVGVIVDADRMNVQAANAFLKTLEEPPASSVLILLATEPQRLLETILSRCLRLTFASQTGRFKPVVAAWVASFGEQAAKAEGGLFGRYKLLSVLMKRLGDLRIEIEKTLAARSPLERYEELEPKMRERLEDELTAAVEAEYRRQRGDLLSGLQWWLRDVWLQTMRAGDGLVSFPDLQPKAEVVSKRISPRDALENLRLLDLLQRQLRSNVQEALALEVGLLRLKL